MIIHFNNHFLKINYKENIAYFHADIALPTLLFTERILEIAIFI